MFDFNNKVALVTGGLGGMGLEIVKEILRNGAKGVTILDLRNVQREQLLEDIYAEYKHKLFFYPTDITDAKQLEDAYKRTVETFKQLDVVVNTAAIINEHNWELCINVNLTALILSTKLAMDTYLPKYKSNEDGLIINIASIGGIDKCSFNSVYMATKSAVITYGRTLGESYDQTKIRILTVCPGLTDTPILNDIFENTLVRDHPALKEIMCTQKQSPYFVAKAVIKVGLEGKSGSVWISECEEVYEVEFLNHEMMRKK